MGGYTKASLTELKRRERECQKIEQKIRAYFKTKGWEKKRLKSISH